MTEVSFALPTQARAWMAINVLGAALCLGWLGTQAASSVEELSWPALLLVGLLWSGLQWAVLRQSVLPVTPLWIVTSLLSWALMLPLLIPALEWVPQSADDLAQYATNFGDARFAQYDFMQYVIGYFAAITLPAFFGILASLPFTIPQWAALALHAPTRPISQRWMGSGAWGWVIGLVVGSMLVSIMAGLLGNQPALPQIMPRWLTYTIVGGCAGFLYGLATHEFVLGSHSESPVA